MIGVAKWAFQTDIGQSWALTNADLLRDALRDAAAHSDAVIAKGDNGFGDVYVVRFSMRTARGAATVLSAWIVRHGELKPRC